MTLSEFKAFLEGMDIKDGEAPTAEQWGRIKEKIGLFSKSPSVTYRGDPRLKPSAADIQKALEWPFYPCT